MRIVVVKISFAESTEVALAKRRHTARRRVMVYCSINGTVVHRSGRCIEAA